MPFHFLCFLLFCTTTLSPAFNRVLSRLPFEKESLPDDKESLPDDHDSLTPEITAALEEEQAAKNAIAAARRAAEDAANQVGAWGCLHRFRAKGRPFCEWVCLRCTPNRCTACLAQHGLKGCRYTCCNNGCSGVCCSDYFFDKRDILPSSLTSCKICCNFCCFIVTGRECCKR